MIRFAGTVSKSWMADAIGIPFDHNYYFDPPHRHAIDSECNAYLRERVGPLALFFTESNLGRIAYYSRRQVLIGGIQPNMIIGMLVGADFVPHNAMDADISPVPLAGKSPMELPSSASLIQHPIVQQFTKQFRRVQDDADTSLDPVPPFFWDGSGRPAIHGALTTAQKLFGDSIFLDLISDPDRGAAILDWTTDVSIALVAHFASLGGRNVTEVHVGECSACMVGPDVFDQFVIPTVSRVSRELGPVRLHSCGPSDHLLDSCRKIDDIHSLDIGGGTSVVAARELFGNDFQIDIAPLVDDLLSPTPHALLAWADNVIEQNAGGPLTIACHVESGYNLDHLRALHDRIAATSG